MRTALTLTIAGVALVDQTAAIRFNRASLHNKREHHEYNLLENNATMNATSFVEFNSTMATELPSGWEVKSANSQYPCASGYKVLPTSYNNANSREVCNKLEAWTIARTATGGSQDGPGYNCNNRNLDTRALGDAVCAQWTVRDIKLNVNGDGNCPSGYGIMSHSEVVANKDAVCRQLGQWTIAKTAPFGTIHGQGYQCQVSAIRKASDAGIRDTVCASINLSAVQRTVHHEGQTCGNGKSFVTIREVLNYQDEICNSLGQWGIARLAGGASIMGRGYGCEIKEVDQGGLGHAICANSGR